MKKCGVFYIPNFVLLLLLLSHFYIQFDMLPLTHRHSITHILTHTYTHRHTLTHTHTHTDGHRKIYPRHKFDIKYNPPDLIKISFQIPSSHRLTYQSFYFIFTMCQIIVPSVIKKHKFSSSQKIWLKNLLKF